MMLYYANAEMFMQMQMLNILIMLIFVEMSINVCVILRTYDATLLLW